MTDNIYSKFILPKKQFAVLIDPDNQTENQLLDLVNAIEASQLVDFIFVGGSTMISSINVFIDQLKKLTSLPVILFPGSVLQVSAKADAMLYLSLISGRNPEYLIGQHVMAAPMIKQSGIEVIPTGYMLIDCGQRTSVQYISNTNPIPYKKTDIAVATAIAGEFFGYKLMYIEGGSGADKIISSEMCKHVKQAISIPLIVGGGIKTYDDAKMLYQNGADILVVGTAFEKDSTVIKSIAKAKLEF